MSHTHIQDHVDLIAKHEEEFLASRTSAERLSDGIAAFVGSIPFVVTHALAFTAWILFNSIKVPHIPHFDPPPFSLLSTIVGMEAILLVSFVLMRQFRSSKRSEERDHMALQVLLLVEKELTLLLRMERQLGNEEAVEQIANSREARDLSKTMSIEAIAKTIRETLPND